MKTITKEELINKILVQIEDNNKRNDWNGEKANATLYLALSNLIKE